MKTLKIAPKQGKSSPPSSLGFSENESDSESDADANRSNPLETSITHQEGLSLVTVLEEEMANDFGFDAMDGANQRNESADVMPKRFSVNDDEEEDVVETEQDHPYSPLFTRPTAMPSREDICSMSDLNVSTSPSYRKLSAPPQRGLGKLEEPTWVKGATLAVAERPNDNSASFPRKKSDQSHISENDDMDIINKAKSVINANADARHPVDSPGQGNMSISSFNRRGRSNVNSSLDEDGNETDSPGSSECNSVVGSLIKAAGRYKTKRGAATASMGSIAFDSMDYRSMEDGMENEPETEIKSRSYLAYDDNGEKSNLAKRWKQAQREHSSEAHGNKYVFAVKTYTRLMSESATFPVDLFLSRSWAFYMRGMYTESFEDASSAIELNPQNITGYLRAGAALEALGEVEDADVIFKEGLAVDEKDVRLKKAVAEVTPLVLRERGEAAMMAKDFSLAAKIFAEGGQLKGQLRPFFLVSQSKAHSMDGSSMSAKAAAQKVVQEHPRYVDGYMRLCEALVAIGDVDAAREVAQKGIVYDPTHEGMTQLLTAAADESSHQVTVAKQIITEILQASPEELPRVLENVDTKLDHSQYSAVGKVWKAALQQLLPEGDEEIWGSTSIAVRMLFDLRQAIPSIDRDKSWKMVSLLSHQAFSFSGSKNRACLVDMAIAGWKELMREALQRRERQGAADPSSQMGGSPQGSFRRGRRWSLVQQATKKSLVEKAVNWLSPVRKEQDATNEVPAFNHEAARASITGMTKIGALQKGSVRAMLAQGSMRKLQASMSEKNLVKREITGRQQAGIDLCLGYAYTECTSLPKEQTMEFAIECFEEAITLLSQREHPNQWAAAHHGCAKSYQMRVKGYPPENQAKAVQHLMKAMTVYTPETGAVRHAGVQLEVGYLFAKAGDLSEGLSHMELALEVLEGIEHDDADAALWAHVHCSIAEALMENMFNAKGYIRPDSAQKTVTAALMHYEKALEVYSIEKHPIDYVMTKSRAASIVVHGATQTIFDMHGLVCLFQGNRTKLLIAYQEYTEALAAGEAIGMVVRGMGLPMGKVHHDAMKGLNEVFAGCIKTAIRLGMYAEALALSERARAHSVACILLSSPCQANLLKNVPVAMVTQYVKLKTKLDAHRARLMGLGKPSSSSRRYKGMLRCAAAFIGFLHKVGFGNWNPWFRLLFMHTPQIEGRPSMWEKEPLIARDEAMIEWFIGTDAAFAFIISFDQHAPKTIEYTTKQLEQIRSSILRLQQSLTPEDTMEGLSAVAKALRIHTVLASLPPGVSRLVLVPHGELMEVPIHALPLPPVNISGDDGILLRTGSNKSSSGAPLDNTIFVCDKFKLGVFYAYSIKLLSWVREKEDPNRFMPVMTAVAVGQPRNGAKVDYCDIESKAIRGVINKVRILSGQEVTADKITQDVVEAARKGGGGGGAKETISVQNSDVLHVACKCVSHVDLGFASWMENSDDAKNYSYDVTSWPLEKCRIVTLASHAFARGEAAESNHSGVKYGGMPTGFLVGGANCVICSYWIVKHECRVVFWAKFYEALTSKGLDVGETLKLTQIWMRDVHELEYLQSFPKEMQGGDWEERVEAAEAGEGQYRPDEKPFLSPYYWAAYAVHGDGSLSGKLQLAVKKRYDYSAAIRKYEMEHPASDTNASKE